MRLPVQLERLAGAPGAVEREHQVCPQPLAQRLFGDERLQLADEVAMPAAGQVRLQPVFERPEAQLLEPTRLAA